MAKIIVEKTLLETKLSKVKDGDLLELRIVPSGNDEGEQTPTFLHIASIHNENEYQDLE